MELQGWGSQRTPLELTGEHGLRYHGGRRGQGDMTAVLFQSPVGCESWPREVRMPELDLRDQRACGL